MKRLGIIAALFVAATAFSAGNGDNAKTFGFGVFVGGTVPAGPMAEDSKAGYALGGKAVVRITERFYTEAVVGFYPGLKLTTMEAEKAEAGGETVPKSTLIPVHLGGNYKVVSAETWSLYAGLGGGIYFKEQGGAANAGTKGDPDPETGEGRISKPGGYAVMGYTRNLGAGISLDLCPRFNFAPSAETITIKVGDKELTIPESIKDTFFTFTAGVNFSLI
jgi:hypothetical protein